MGWKTGPCPEVGDTADYLYDGEWGEDEDVYLGLLSLRCLETSGQRWPTDNKIQVWNLRE